MIESGRVAWVWRVEGSWTRFHNLILLETQLEWQTKGVADAQTSPSQTASAKNYSSAPRDSHPLIWDVLFVLSRVEKQGVGWRAMKRSSPVIKVSIHISCLDDSRLGKTVPDQTIHPRVLLHKLPAQKYKVILALLIICVWDMSYFSFFLFERLFMEACWLPHRKESSNQPSPPTVLSTARQVVHKAGHFFHPLHKFSIEAGNWQFLPPPANLSIGA